MSSARLEGLSDDPRPGVPRSISDEKVEEVVVKTLESMPKDATHWSTRSLAKQVGISPRASAGSGARSGCSRGAARRSSSRPTRSLSRKSKTSSACTSTRPSVPSSLAVDEKSQIQALNRFQPVLPMLPWTPERRSHDYTRYGTTSLFAALDTLNGTVISSLHRRHRALEFKKFLERIDAEVPDELDVHLILDNYATHKTPTIKRWLLRHPRFHLHFTPTGVELAQPGRTLVRRAHHQKDQTRSPPLRHRTRTRHQRLDQNLEREPPPLRLGQDRRPDPRLPRPILQTNL